MSTVVINKKPYKLTTTVTLRRTKEGPLIVRGNGVMGTVCRCPARRAFFDADRGLRVNKMPFVARGCGPGEGRTLACCQRIMGEGKVGMGTFRGILGMVGGPSSMFRMRASGNVCATGCMMVTANCCSRPGCVKIPKRSLPGIFRCFGRTRPCFSGSMAMVNKGGSDISTTVRLIGTKTEIAIVCHKARCSPDVGP